VPGIGTLKPKKCDFDAINTPEGHHLAYARPVGNLAQSRPINGKLEKMENVKNLLDKILDVY